MDKEPDFPVAELRIAIDAEKFRILFVLNGLAVFSFAPEHARDIAEALTLGANEAEKLWIAKQTGR